MKNNGIIYPNTPFFRKYGGKLIMPAGVEEEGGAAFELVPVEVTELLGLPENPYFEESSGDASAIFMLTGPSIESMRFNIDNLTAEHTGGESDEIFELNQTIINEQLVEMAHESGIDYFDDKLEQYFSTIIVYISHMEGYTPLAVGEHPYSLSANGEEVNSGNFTV